VKREREDAQYIHSASAICRKNRTDLGEPARSSRFGGTF